MKVTEILKMEIKERGIPLVDLKSDKWREANNIRYLGELFERYKDRKIDIKAVLLYSLEHIQKKGDINSNQLEILKKDLAQKVCKKYNSWIGISRVLFYEKYESYDATIEVIKETLDKFDKIDYYSILLLNYISSRNLLSNKQSELFEKVITFLTNAEIDINYNNPCFSFIDCKNELLMFFKDFLKINKITKTHLKERYNAFVYLKKIGTYKDKENIEKIESLFKYQNEAYILNLLLCDLRYRTNSKILAKIISYNLDYIQNIPWNNPIFNKLGFKTGETRGCYYIGNEPIESYNFSTLDESNFNDFLKYVSRMRIIPSIDRKIFDNVKAIKNIDKDLFFSLKKDYCLRQIMFMAYSSFEEKDLVVDLFDSMLEISSSDKYQYTNIHREDTRLNVLIKGLNFGIFKNSEEETYNEIVDKLNAWTGYEWLKSRATPNVRKKIFSTIRERNKNTDDYYWILEYIDDNEICLSNEDLVFLQNNAILGVDDYIPFIFKISKIEKYKNLLNITDDDIFSFVEYLIKNERTFDIEKANLDKEIKSRFDEIYLKKINEDKIIDKFWKDVLCDNFIGKHEADQLKDILKNKSEEERNHFFKNFILKSGNLSISTWERIAKLGIIPVELFFVKFKLAMTKEENKYE